MASIDIGALERAVDDMLDGVAVGDDVISFELDSVATYGGPDEHGSQFVMVIGVGTGGITVKCPLGHVAPADIPITDGWDRLFVVIKGSSVQGNWALGLTGGFRPTWHKTKRAAVAAGRRRMAIIQWHTTRSNGGAA